MKPISLLMLTKNSAELIANSLGSIGGLVNEIIIVDNGSQDKTVDICKSFGAKVYVHTDMDLGKQRAFGLSKTTNSWILALDHDEVVTDALKKEILHLKSSRFAGYYIPFQNHFLGKPIRYGGEDYKMLRFFKKDAVSIHPSLIHEHFEIAKGPLGVLKHRIYHYSYRSLGQMFGKFTDYALREARQKKERGEKTSLKKIILYPAHMFWARFIKDKGYKDGLFRIPLDIGFAYMEFLTYCAMIKL